MRINSKLFCGIFGGAALLTCNSAFASIIGVGSLYITADGYFNTGDQAGPYEVSGLTSVTGVNPGSAFSTFCIGSQVDYYPGTTYGYEISDTVQPASGVGSPGYVTWGTAFLYSEFRTGEFGAQTANNPMADALQEAIWVLQGQSLNNITYSPNQTDFTNYLNLAASAAAAHGLTSDTVDANGAYGVYALNLCPVGGSGGTTYYQPQLCMVAVPEPTTCITGALMLMPFGASALRSIRKRCLKAA